MSKAKANRVETAVRDVEDALAVLAMVTPPRKAARVVADAVCAAGFTAATVAKRRAAVRRLRAVTLSDCPIWPR